MVDFVGFRNCILQRKGIRGLPFGEDGGICRNHICPPHLLDGRNQLKLDMTQLKDCSRIVQVNFGTCIFIFCELLEPGAEGFRL